MRAIDAFGAGLGAHGEVCGALSGGLAVIGLMYGKSERGSFADNRMWRMAHVFMRRFREEVVQGSILCRDIARVDWLDPESVKEFRLGPKRVHCTKLTGHTAGILGEIMEEE